jgi:hypothetical protein
MDETTQRRMAARERGLRQVRMATGVIGAATATLAAVFAVSLSAPPASSTPSLADDTGTSQNQVPPRTAGPATRTSGRLAAPTTLPHATGSPSTAPTPRTSATTTARHHARSGGS